MTLADDVVSERGDSPEPSTPTWPWWAFGLANVAVSIVLAVLSWWLIVDPQWSAFGLYPQPFTALLFWTILATVWVGFTFGWTGPDALAQPLRGLVGILITLVISVTITLVLAYGWGAIDPSFAADREGGAGYTTGNLFVLFGFYFFVCAAINADHWPWSGRASRAMTGVGALTLVLIPTAALYAVLALPNLALWGHPDGAIMSLPTLIGWFYSVVVSAIVTGLLAENLPWALVRGPGRTAVVAVLGNFVLGTVIYFVVLPIAKVLMGSDNVAALGPAVTMHAAELGVCWAFWMIAWANVFGNKPTGFARSVNITIRVVVTFVLGAATYLAYYFVLAPHVLHEPAAAGSLSGDALGFVDWAVLWMLWYVLFLGSYGLPKPRADQAT